MATTSEPVPVTQVPVVLPYHLKECPICLEELKSPIHQCKQGHIICKQCLTKTNVCYSCQEGMPRPPIRNRALEEVIESFSNLFFENRVTPPPNAVNIQNNSNSTVQRGKRKHEDDDPPAAIKTHPKVVPAQSLVTVTPEVHRDISCDGPNCSDRTDHPIIGIRYRCIECENYDLCEKCERSGVHNHHLFIRIAKPILKFRADTYYRKCRKDD